LVGDLPEWFKEMKVGVAFFIVAISHESAIYPSSRRTWQRREIGYLFEKKWRSQQDSNLQPAE
jgi:hypothetical protein